MTINLSTTKVQYNGNGSTTTFIYAFQILEDDDLLVFVTDSTGLMTTLVLNSDYTVTGAGESSGGTVVLTSGTLCATGETLTIMRDVDILQETDYVDGDAFSAESFEDALDKMTVILQQFDERLDRCVTAPKSINDDFEIDGVEYDNRANKVMGFNADGDVALLPASLTAEVLADAYYINISDAPYNDSLTTLASELGGTVADVLVDAEVTTSAITTLPSTMRLHVTKKGHINNSHATTFNCELSMEGGYFNGSGDAAINGVFIAGAYRVFRGSGTITGLKEARPEWFVENAVPGTTDMSDGFTSAAAVSNVIQCTNTTYLAGGASLPNKNLLIRGGFTSIVGTAGAGSIFTQTNRGVLTAFEGIDFSGPKVAFYRNAGTGETPYMGSTAYFEYQFDRCTFNMDVGVYGVNLFGSREGRFNLCTFDGGDATNVASGHGFYSEYSIGPEFQNCYWLNCDYATNFNVGTEGVKVHGGTFIGNTYGIYSYRLYGLQAIGVMIDYNDHSILCENSGAGVVSGCYVSSRTSDPAIEVKWHDVIEYDNNNWTIANNPTIRCNGTRSDSTCAIRLEHCNYITVHHNPGINGWKTNGIEYTECTFLDIHNNAFFPEPLIEAPVNPADYYGDYSIYQNGTWSGDTSVKIHDNLFVKPISCASVTYVKDNSGYVTENSGVDTILSGGTSVTVTHGLDMTPGVNNIKLQPYVTITLPLSVANITATTFDVVVNSATGKNYDFGWSVSIV